MIPPDDGIELRWYFQQGRPGAGSTGDEWARVLLYATAAPPCERCGGDVKRHLAGTGFVDARTGRAEDDDEAVRRLVLASMSVDLGLPFGNQVCPDCDGSGWATARAAKPTVHEGLITARPTGSSVPLASVPTMPASDPPRLARISAWLWRVAERQGDLPATAALEWYYTEELESLESLWPLTPAGKKLLRKNADATDSLVFLEKARHEQRLRPDPNRKALFIAAADQAERLWLRTADLWVLCAPSATNHPPPVKRPQTERPPLNHTQPETGKRDRERMDRAVEGLRRVVSRKRLAG